MDECHQGTSAFSRHYQPHLPADLGFYDLRVAESREAQADLAREYGVTGFCYYHYWFSGKRLLHRPFDEVLTSGRPNFPFCLCWANENWTRIWDGGESEVLMEQTYSERMTLRTFAGSLAPLPILVISESKISRCLSSIARLSCRISERRQRSGVTNVAVWE